MNLGEMFASLNDIKPTDTIPDSDMEMLLARFCGNLSTYYLDEKYNNNREYELGNYAIQFLETKEGYLVTVADMVKKIYRKKFAVISYGDWAYDDKIFKGVGVLDILMDVTKDSYDFLDRYDVPH